MPIESLPAADVFKAFVNDFGLTKDGQRTKNPWQYDALPKEILEAPVQFYIYNVGPIQQIINAGSMGQHRLFPPEPGQRYGKPLAIKKYMVDWADQGDYKHKPVIMDGEYVAKEWVTPNGERETDLRGWGVFYSPNNPPTEAELATAEAALRKTLFAIVQRGDDLWEAGKRREITPIYRIAADAVKEVRDWCKTSHKMLSCPGCGEPVKEGIRKHVACGFRLDLGCFDGEQTKTAGPPVERAATPNAKTGFEMKV